MSAGDLVLALTGASGAPYGVRLLEVLLRAGRTVHLTVSPAGAEVLEQELERRLRLEDFDLHDLLGEAAALAAPLERCGRFHRRQDLRPAWRRARPAAAVGRRRRLKPRLTPPRDT